MQADVFRSRIPLGLIVIAALAIVVTTYDAFRQFAATYGLVYLFALFLGVVVYALWPRNKKKFDDAAHIPLRDDLP